MKDWNAKKILDILWKGKILLIVFVVIGGIIGYTYNKVFTKPIYQSSSSIILSVTNEDAKEIISENNIDGIEDDDTRQKVSQGDLSLSKQLMSTYSQIIKSESVIKKVIANLQLSTTPEKLKNDIIVTPQAESAVIKITVNSTSAEEAATIVEEIDKVFFDRIAELYNITNAKVLDEPIVENVPSNINPEKYAVIGGLIGLVLAFSIIIIKEYLNDNIKTESDVENGTKLPTLSQIEHFNNSNGKLIAFNESHMSTESFRVLVANIKYFNIQSLLVLSNMPEEGKSVVSANLALTFAASGKKTLLIDSDMRKGTQHEIFDIKNDKGLSNLILDDITTFDNYIKKDVVENLDIITKGNASLNYSKLLFSNTIENIIKQAKKKYDFIIVDGTPNKLVADGSLLYKTTDSTLIVVKYNNTKVSDVNKIKTSIQRNGGNILGVVINNIPKGRDGYKDYSYYGNSKLPVSKTYSSGKKKITKKES